MSMNKRAKKSLVLTLGLVIGGMYASANNIYAAEKEVVKAEKLNVRKGPSIEDERIASLDRGMVVEILETSNGWNKVKLSDGEEGWVNGDYTAKEKATVTADKLNVRKGPSIEDEKIGSLTEGTVVELLEEENNWYKVQLSDGNTGWISGDYVLTESQANNNQQDKEDNNDTLVQQSNETKKENKTVVSNATQNNASATSEKNEVKKEETKKQEVAASTNKNGCLMTVNASAYSGHNITATGTTPKWGTIAVDPSVIPYGTRVYIPKFDMVFTAEDCGGAIKGNKIDIFMNSESDCVNFGRQNIEIQILN